MTYKDFEFWNKEKLWKLRNEIVLNSLFFSDYKNSFGIPMRDCGNFFDGFIGNCFIIEEENENGLTIFQDIMDKYDNENDLWDYFCGLEYPFGEYEE